MKNRHTAAGYARLLLAYLAIAFVVLPSAAHAGQATEPLQVTFVYSQQCLSCEHTRPSVEKVLAETPVPIKVSRYDINTREGAEYARAHGIVSIPAVVVNCGPPLLFEDYSSVEAYDNAIRERIACEAGYGPCRGVVPHSCTTEKKLTELSIPAAFIAGLIAGVNPCLLAVMAFIASTTLAASGRGSSIVLRVIAFCGGLLTIYLLIGIGLMELMRMVPELDVIIKGAIIIILVLMAAWSFYDAWRVSRGIESKSFKSVIRRFHRSYERFALPASFAIGAAFGLVKMPCIGGLYIAILGSILQSERFAEGFVYLVFYNLGVVLPVLVLGGLLAYGLSPAALNAFRIRHRVKLKFFTGVLLAGMATAFVLGII